MYRVLHGLRISGESWINPYTNQATKFAFSGNPVYEDRLERFITGQYVIIGSIFGNVPSLDTIQFSTTSLIKRGTSNINSIAELKNCVNSVINVSNNSENVPAKFILHQNYPNPFNPSTTIKFEIIELESQPKIYDMLGREVRELISARLTPGII